MGDAFECRIFYRLSFIDNELDVPYTSSVEQGLKRSVSAVEPRPNYLPLRLTPDAFYYPRSRRKLEFSTGGDSLI